MSSDEQASKRPMLPSSRRVSSYTAAHSILRSRDFAPADLLSHLQALQLESGEDFGELLAWVSGSLEFQSEQLHRQSRRLLAKHFGAATIRLWKPWIEREARTALKHMLSASKPDLVQGYAIPLLTALVPAILGIRPDTGRSWLDQAICIRSLVEPCLSIRQLLRIQQACSELLKALDISGSLPMDERPPALMTRLLHDESSDLPLAQKKLLVANLVIGALAIAQTLPKIAWALFSEDSEERIDANAAIWVDRNLERMLRLHASTSLLGRIAQYDLLIDDGWCSAGDRIAIDIPAANRDPVQFPCTRNAAPCPHGESPNAHLGFGVGAHKCPGADLSRAVLGVAIEEMLLLNPAPRFIESEVRWHSSVMARYPICMPIHPGLPRPLQVKR